MASTNTVRTYAKADTATGNVNVASLATEIDEDATITTPLASIPQEVGTDIVITFAGLLSSAEVTALDAVVAAHQGTSFPADLRYTASSVGESTNATNTPVEKLKITTDPLPAGKYLLQCMCEFDCSSTAPNTAAQIHLNYNGTEQLSDTWEEIAEHAFSAGLMVDVEDGKTIELQLTFQKIGAGSLTAQCRRARMVIAPVRG